MARNVFKTYWVNMKKKAEKSETDKDLLVKNRVEDFPSGQDIWKTEKKADIFEGPTLEERCF